MVRSSSHIAGITTLSVEKDELPEWLHEKLKVEREEVCQMEVSIQSHEQYAALVGYLATRAVDVNERAPRWCERIHASSSNADDRPYPGKLSSLQMLPVDPWEWTDDSSSDSESDDSDDDDEEEEDSPTIGIGYGWGCVKTNPVRSNERNAFYQGEADVFFHHFAMGDPMVVMDDALVLYKVIVLYAESTKILQKLCREAMEWQRAKDEVDDDDTSKPEKYQLLKCKVGEDKEWVYHGKLRSRPMASIILAPGMENAINLDFELFLNIERRKFYHEHGLTYKRTYLFHGPANTGKKSVVYALAGLYGRKVCMLDLSSDTFTETALKEALSSLPKNCILVVENVDAIESFGNLLEALESMVSKDGVITVFTAKDIDQLNPALMRLGRVDRRFEFSEPRIEEIARYFSSFYPRAGSSIANKFAESVLQRTESEAKQFTTLAQFFIYCAGEPAASACEKLDDFFLAFFPPSNEPTSTTTTAPRVHHV